MTHSETESHRPSELVGPTTAQVWRRLRMPLILLCAILLVAVGIGLAQTRTTVGELDPRAVDPAGSRAVAELLNDHGVDVRRVTSIDDALDLSIPGTKILLPFPNLMRREELARLNDRLPRESSLVLVGPDEQALTTVTDRVDTVGENVDVQARPPRCDADVARTAGSVDLGDRTYRAGEQATGCYPANGESSLVLAQTRTGIDLVVMGAGTPLTNDRLDDEGNAALSLLLLGADNTAPRVVWLMPLPGSSEPTSTTPFDVLPAWAKSAGIQLALAVLVVIFWRARRLGPPVVEPLPVVVRAAEVVEGRGRLYRRAKARDRAADALRAGVLDRLLPRIGLGRHPRRADVVRAVATRSEWPEQKVDFLLFGPSPPTDSDLVGLAHDLDALVLRTLSTGRGKTQPT